MKKLISIPSIPISQISFTLISLSSIPNPKFLLKILHLFFFIGFPRSVKKVETHETDAFASTLLVLVAAAALLLLSVKAADKTPKLEYGIIRRNDNAPPSTTHPPPLVNDPSRGCNAETFCRHFTLSVENPSGTRVEAVAIVQMGAPLNRSEAGTEAIVAGMAAWSLNKTNGNASVWLSVSMDPIANATDSAQMFQLEAVSRGIASTGLRVQKRSAASMDTEDAVSSSLVYGEITITVDAASNRVVLNFLTQVQSLGETDIIQILEYAKAKFSNLNNIVHK